MDIEQFYEADERRRRSEEIELGTEWHDETGARYEVSWVADTGELYVMCEPRAEIVELPEPLAGDAWVEKLPVSSLQLSVLGWIPTRAQLDEVMTGWEDAMPRSDSLIWLHDRLRAAAVPDAPPPS